MSLALSTASSYSSPVHFSIHCKCFCSYLLTEALFSKVTDIHLISKSSGLFSGFILFNFYLASNTITHRPLSSWLPCANWECLLRDSPASLLGLSEPLTPLSSCTCSSIWGIPKLYICPLIHALPKACRSKLERNDKQGNY